MASTRIVALYGNDTTGADMSTYETSNYGTRIWRKGRTAPRRRAARPDATMIFAAPRRRQFPAVLAVAALGALYFLFRPSKARRTEPAAYDETEDVF